MTTPKERRELMDEADSFGELLAYACDVPVEEGAELVQWVEEVEAFLSEHGFNRAKPRKAAVLYVMMRHGHTATTVAKWWGETDSRYWSLSPSTAKGYLDELEELVEEHEEAVDGDGFKVYEATEDPLDDYYDIGVSSYNAELCDF